MFINQSWCVHKNSGTDAQSTWMCFIVKHPETETLRNILMRRPRSFVFNVVILSDEMEAGFRPPFKNHV